MRVLKHFDMTNSKHMHNNSICTACKKKLAHFVSSTVKSIKRTKQEKNNFTVYYCEVVSCGT